MDERDEGRAAREEIIRRVNAGQAKREEIISRLNADDELPGKADSDSADKERQHTFKNEIEKDQKINRGWFARRFGAGDEGPLSLLFRW
jgi:hypothetical protein